jgi:hypothetical protein
MSVSNDLIEQAISRSICNMQLQEFDDTQIRLYMDITKATVADNGDTIIHVHCSFLNRTWQYVFDKDNRLDDSYEL